MPQNKYDDPDFFRRYSAMDRSLGGLDRAGEWPAFRALLPKLANRRVLDLGCGFGWHCRYARENGARSVTGVDVSEKMLDRARAETGDPTISYVRAAIEDIDFAPNSFDVVISSLAFHYVERFDLVCGKVHACLAPGGDFVFSVEHPVFTARAAQDWILGPAGERLYWAVDGYTDEGPRRTSWLAEDVVKYHRTLATYIDTVIDSGFTLMRIAEPGPPPEMLADDPAAKDDLRRPTFLLVAARKARDVVPG